MQERDHVTEVPDFRKIALRIFFAILLINIAFAGGHLYTMDDHTNYEVVDAIWMRHDAVVQPADPSRHLNTVTGVDGRKYSYYGLGGPLVYFPFYIAGHFAGKAHGAVHYLSQAGMALTNAFSTAFTAAMIFLLLLKLNHSTRAACWSAMIYAFATPAFVWSKHQSNSVLVGALFITAIYCLVKKRVVAEPSTRISPSSESLIWSVLAGVALGLAVNVRYDAAIGAVMIVVFSPLLTGSPGIGSGMPKSLSLKPVAAMGLGAIPFVAMLLFYNWHRFGSLWTLGYPDLDVQGQFSASVLDGLYGLLFSPNRGLLIYGPVLILLPLAWHGMTRAGRFREILLFTLIPIVYLFFYASIPTWHGGMGWGPRYLACVLPILCCSFGCIFSMAADRTHIAVRMLIAVSICIQIWGGLASIDSYHDHLVESGIDPLVSAYELEYAPMWGLSHVVSSFTMERVSKSSALAPLPAGGYPITRNLRATPDFWPFYAYKLGIDVAICLISWLAVFISGVTLLKRILSLTNKLK